MVVSLSTNHSSDWEWQAVLGQMEDLRLQNYILKLKQDAAGSTYWTITPKGENYLRALEHAESPTVEPTSENSSGDAAKKAVVEGRTSIPSADPWPDASSKPTVGEPDAAPDLHETSGYEIKLAEGVEVAIRALSDKPSDIDLLEFADYAQALTDFIENEKTQTPLTIGIDGAWGSGKTTLMRMIQTRLTPRGKTGTSRPPTRTVWFNAWKYDREESLWASLALEILSQVRRQCRWYERASLWFSLNWKRFDKGKFGSDLLKFILYPAALIIATALGTFVWKQWVNANLDIAKWTKVAAGGGLITTLLAALKQIHDQVVGPFELNISKYIRTPDYRQRIGFLGEFERDFKFVIDAVTNNAKSSLIIFIDDLDRCKPAKPVEVIEAINHLLDAEPCIFVMGMDVRSIAGSVEAKYKDLAESSVAKDLTGGLPLGYRFLEKIIQVPFRLPQVSHESLGRLVNGSLSPRAAPLPNRAEAVAEAEHLIKSEEDQGKDLKEAAETVRSERPDISPDALMEAKQNVFARTFDDDEEVREAIYDALPYLESNARKVKRFINLFRLQLLIANRRHLLENSAIEIRQLSRWLVLVVRWPEIIDALNDPAFPPRLLEAHKLWRSSVNETGGLENAQAIQVLLKPYLDDPRVKRFVDVSNLIDLLRAFIPNLGTSRDLPDVLEPYLQLSAIPTKSGKTKRS